MISPSAFFGVDNGSWTVHPYTFDDVVRTLDGVVADDWATFLRARLDGRTPITGGIAARRAGSWCTKTSPTTTPRRCVEGQRGGADFLYSLGFTVDKDGKLGEVRWDSPAFRAGIGTGMQLVAVNGREYKKATLEDVVKAAKAGHAPITLLVKDFDRYRTHRRSTTTTACATRTCSAFPARRIRLSAIYAARK